MFPVHHCVHLHFTLPAFHPLVFVYVATGPALDPPTDPALDPRTDPANTFGATAFIISIMNDQNKTKRLTLASIEVKHTFSIAAIKMHLDGRNQN